MSCFKPVTVIYEGDMVIEIGETENSNQLQNTDNHNELNTMDNSYHNPFTKDIQINMNHQSINFNLNEINKYPQYYQQQFERYPNDMIDNNYNNRNELIHLNQMIQPKESTIIDMSPKTIKEKKIKTEKNEKKEKKQLKQETYESKQIKEIEYTKEEKINQQIKEEKQKKEIKEKKPKKEKSTLSCVKQKVSVEEEKKFPKVRVTLEAFEELQQFRKKYKCKSYCEVVNKLLNIYDSIQHHENDK